jgi:fructokinase
MPIQVLTLGEMLYDLIADQPGLPLGQVTSWQAYAGGAPANVATALAKLGTPTGWIGCLGCDPAGDALVQVLRDRSVDLGGVQRHPTAPTRQVYVTRTIEGDRQFAGFGTGSARIESPGAAPESNAPESSTPESSTPESGAFADAHLQGAAIAPELFQRVKFLVLGTLGLAEPASGEAMRRAVALAQAASVEIVIDVNWRPVFWRDFDLAGNFDLAKGAIAEFLGQAHWLKLSDEEAEWLYGSLDPSQVVQIVQSQCPTSPLKGLVITAGAKGCAYAVKSHRREGQALIPQWHLGQVPGFRVDVEDTTGAGDSFLAGLLHQLCHPPQALWFQASNGLDGAWIDQIMVYASAVGALTTVQAGAIEAQPHNEDVEAFIYLQREMEKNHGARD